MIKIYIQKLQICNKRKYNCNTNLNKFKVKNETYQLGHYAFWTTN